MADQVQRIEARMASHSTSLLEEKKNVQEIAKLTKEMTLLTEYNSFRKEMQTLQDAKTVMLSKIRDNRSTLSAVRTALKTAEVQEKLSKRKGSQVNSESVHVEHVEFSEATMNVLATKGMIVIRRIESECNVVIELERKRNLARIYGVETDAKTAKQQLSAIDFSTTDRFSVDSKDIPIVLGKNGSTVQSMESAYNVLVDIDKKNNMVVITGAASAVSKAKEALQRAIEEGQVVSVSVDGISSEAVSLLRNNAGERISKMMTDSGANISIISANNSIKIRGSQAAVNAAQETLSRFIDDTVVEVLPAPADKLGLIMGKGGSNLNQIRDAHRAMIVRLSDGFQIIGTRRDVDSARRPLKALIDHTLAGPTVIKAEEYQMGAVIGKGGSTIQRIESESGATLDVDKETCSVKIRGTIEAVAKAKRAVELVISNEQKLEIPVPADSIPGLMGKGGVNINNLAHENNVSIDIDRKKDLIKIRGSKAAIGQAQIAIKKLLVVSAPVTQSVELTPEQYSLFTSDSLSNGRYVREQTNVSIESDKKTHTLTVKGIPAAVEKAKTLIHSIASGRVYCDLPLLPKHMEQIKAQNITKLQRDSRTIVTFTESGLRISGREEDVHKAKTQLEQMLQFFFSKEIQTFPLDSGSMLLVSSPRGRTALKKTRDDMNQQSGSPLILDIDRKRNCIVIRAEAEAVVETVKSAIRDMLLRLESSSNQNAPSATGLTNGNAEMCVFEFPIERHLVSRLIGRKGQSINKIKASSGLKKIDIDDAKGVAILRGTVEAVEKAKELIAETLRPTPRPLQRPLDQKKRKRIPILKQNRTIKIETATRIDPETVRRTPVNHPRIMQLIRMEVRKDERGRRVLFQMLFQISMHSLHRSLHQRPSSSPNGKPRGSLTLADLP
eukprot:GILJ01013653.1.p1 GENE.GILJ01013653.1~~GILJ01013653.1.p1  ORF type:complete len:990 (-),score=175.13 GILJ01013653.1:234-2921(-)